MAKWHHKWSQVLKPETPYRLALEEMGLTNVSLQSIISNFKMLCCVGTKCFDNSGFG